MNYQVSACPSWSPKVDPDIEMSLADDGQAGLNSSISMSLVAPRRRTATGLMVAGRDLLPTLTVAGV